MQGGPWPLCVGSVTCMLAAPCGDEAPVQSGPRGQGDPHVRIVVLGRDPWAQLVGGCPGPLQARRGRKRCSNSLVKMQECCQKRLYGLFCLRVFIIRHPLRGSQGRLRMSEVGPGNFLLQRLCFLSLLILREQVEALLEILA